jgi:WD40 repeat protein
MQILLLESESLTSVFSIKERDNIIDEVKFSPNGNMLAVGSHQNVIDIYAVNKGYQLVSVLKVIIF